MRRATIALGLLLPTLGACVTVKPVAKPRGLVEAPPPNQPAWTQSATPADQARLAELHDLFVRVRAAVPHSRAKMLAGEGPLVDPSAAEPLAMLPPGPYYCRLVRFGARAYLATFKPDFCYVEAGKGNLAFTKQTGENRPEGWIFPDSDKRQIFLGTFRREGEKGGGHYGDDPSSDVAGIVERVSPFRWRLLLTRAGCGATLDLYELVPVPPEVPGAKLAVPGGGR